jgi:hypothetical protein
MRQTAARDAGEYWLGAAQRSEALACFARDEGFPSRPDECGLFLNAGCFSGALQQLIFDIQGGSHMHRYA